MKEISIFCSSTTYVLSAFSETHIHKHHVRDGECIVLNLNCSDDDLGRGVREVAKRCGTRPDPQNAQEWREVEKPLLKAFGVQSRRQFEIKRICTVAISINNKNIKIYPVKQTTDGHGSSLKDLIIVLDSGASNEVLGCAIREAIQRCDPPGPRPAQEADE